MAWLEMEQNRPSRADYYAMRVAMEVANANGAKGLTLDRFRVRFVAQEKYSNVGEAAKAAKLKWCGAMTLPVRGMPKELKQWTS